MSWLRRLSNTFRRSPLDRDIERELSFHVSERADQLRAEGLSEGEALRRARILFGYPIVQRERTRDIDVAGWLDAFLRHVRFGVRALGRTPGFTVTVVLTLALGIGATTAVFSVVNGVLLRPLAYPEPDALVGVWHSAQFQGMRTSNLRLTATMYAAYREHNRVFEELGIWYEAAASVTGHGTPEEVTAVATTHGALRALGVQPALGRWFSPADDEPGTPETAILSYGYWQRRFAGDPAAVGRAITIDGRLREVIGVMPQGFRFAAAEPEIILPQRFTEAQLQRNDDVHRYIGLARLKPGVSLEQATADVQRMLPLWIEEYGANSRVLQTAAFAPALRPLERDVIGNVGPMLWLLLASIGIVLLIACANVASLLLARGGERRQELAVRAALGAGRGHIARLLLIESVILGVAGGAAGLALAVAGLRLLLANGPADIPRLADITVDPRVLVFTLAASVSCGLLLGLAPAWKYARRTSVRRADMDDGGRMATHGRERHHSQNALAVVQMALAVVLLVAAGLMIRSFQALRTVPPGFTEPEQIQTLRISIPDAQAREPERVVRIQHEIAERIGGIPGVASATFATALPLETEFENNVTLTVEGKRYDEGIPPLRRSKAVAPGFFATLGIPLVAGRDFVWADVYDRRRVAIVSAGMAREEWGDAPAAIGKRIRIGRVGPLTEVVGVVGDIHDSGVHQAPPPIVYWRAGVVGGGALPDYVPREVTFAVRSERTGTEALTAQIAQAVWSVNPNLPLARVQTLGELYQRSMSRTSFMLVMLAAAGSMALALGIVGVYGVLSYTVAQRRREIGIRLALGAARTGILRQFLGHGARVAGLACAAGLVVSIAFARVLASLLYGVSPSDPLTLTGAVATVLTVGILAALIPAARAALVEPARTLRSE